MISLRPKHPKLELRSFPAVSRHRPPRILFVPIIFPALIFAAAVQALAAPYAERMGISHVFPAAYGDWPNGFMAGNGNQGIIVFGDPLNERVIFNDRGFNLAASTNAPYRSFATVKATDLLMIRSNCAAGNFAAANELAVTSAQYHGGGEGNRHPGYEMVITLPPAGDISNYSRTCDYRTGVIAVNWTDRRGRWTRTAFVSRPDNVTVQYLVAPCGSRLNCRIALAIDSQMRFPAAMRFTNRVASGWLNLRAAYSPDTGSAGYEGVTRVITAGGSQNPLGDALVISNAESVLLLTRTAKYYQDCESQWNRQSLQQELAALPASYRGLLRRHAAIHGGIYDRVQLDLGTTPEERAQSNEELLMRQKQSALPVKALWERVFDAGRFYYLCASSSNTPPDLLGIWTGDCNAGWGGFYHLDANANLQVAQGNIGDLPEAMAGYFAINKTWQHDFETNARKLLGCRGMVAAGNTPGTTSGLMAGISDFYPYQYATGEEGWLLYPFWEHFLTTGDTNFLRNDFYPLIHDMGLFYEDFLTLTDTNGNYILAGSVSPENQPANRHVSLLNNSAFDVSGARFCLTALIQTCAILGREQGPGQGIERWTALLHKLPPYRVGQPNNSIGALAEWGWPGLQDSLIHRHMSQLLGVWPYREITPEDTPDLFRAAAAVLAVKDSYHESAGHGILHGALVAANLKNAASVNRRLLQLTREDYYYTGLASSHNDKHGVFCTDTCNTVPAIMMEMLVSSGPGTLELLPALPAALTAGSIRGVKGRNRVTIEQLGWDLSRRMVEVTLKSDIDQTVTLIERDGIASISPRTATSSSPLGQMARTIPLRSGRSVSFAIRLENLR